METNSGMGYSSALREKKSRASPKAPPRIQLWGEWISLAIEGQFRRDISLSVRGAGGRSPGGEYAGGITKEPIRWGSSNTRRLLSSPRSFPVSLRKGRKKPSSRGRDVRKKYSDSGLLENAKRMKPGYQAMKKARLRNMACNEGLIGGKVREEGRTALKRAPDRGKLRRVLRA